MVSGAPCERLLSKSSTLQSLPRKQSLQWPSRLLKGVSAYGLFCIFYVFPFPSCSLICRRITAATGIHGWPDERFKARNSQAPSSRGIGEALDVTNGCCRKPKMADNSCLGLQVPMSAFSTERTVDLDLTGPSSGYCVSLAVRRIFLVSCSSRQQDVPDECVSVGRDAPGVPRGNGDTYRTSPETGDGAQLPTLRPRTPFPFLGGFFYYSMSRHYYRQPFTSPQAPYPTDSGHG